MTNKRWTGSDACPLPLSKFSDGDDTGVRFGDVNGDGLVDILQSENRAGVGSRNYIWINTRCGWATSTLTVPLPSQYTGFTEMDTDPNRDQGGRVVDVNGDGLVDILWTWAVS